MQSLGRDVNNRLEMSADHNRFFEKLGQRIVAFRNEHGLTQVQLAEILGYSEHQVLSFETGRRRAPVSALPERDKEIVKELLDAFLTKRQIQSLAA